MARIVRFGSTQGPRYGLVQDGVVYELIGQDPFRQELEPGQPMGDFETLLIAPPLRPTKIICVGRNYADHAAEHQAEIPEEPMLFLKPPSALIGYDIPIQLPPDIGRVDLEAELAVVVGQGGRDIPKKVALAHVLGYTCANDVSARVFQKKDKQWGRAKGFDTFCPLGPWIDTDLRNPEGLRIQGRLNGNTVIDSNTRQMVFDVPALITFISGIMTLMPGDVILTGTPAGVTAIQPGDSVEIEIEGIGTLRNPVEARV